ncbi:XkdF-like putative serine protease domain-containing protein [Salinilacihabitans rarus]|uniref:XkdF-like putative serine protease domain-containing protein n=1 Tax=Salinilacihabitans rarus TaxID=2961596 RepID=UPI0020C841B9|nr:XkdF-like putative serine protease domain-containing protein [Salinilacihabitans rarus]
MPVQKGETFEKRVEFKATDDERRVATGGVLVPSKVDLQGDWLTSEQIRELADDFMARLQAADDDDVDSVPGVMHAVFPPEHVTLVENRVLEEAETIGGKEFPAGSWIQSWRFDDDELWSLVADGILSGYSIGAIDVKWEGPYDQSELPEGITVADGYPDDEPAWQIVAATIAEVSSVDIPAVPDAVMASVKAAGVQTYSREKNVLDRVGGKDEFLEVMADRGHDEEAATRMWSYLQRAAEEGADQHPADKASDGVLRRMGRAALNAFSSGGPDAESAPQAAAKSTDDGAPSPEATAAKEGRTLSRANRNALFATIDASLDVLQDAGVDHGMTRFTDREEIDWTLDDHTAREWATPDDDEDADGEDDEETAPVDPSFESATGGETPDDTTMSADDTDTDTPDDTFADAPEWAKAIHDQTQENSKRIEELVDDGDEPEKDADEPDDPEKSTDANEDVDEGPPEWAKAIQEQTEKNADRIESLAKASGQSQQLDEPAQTTESTDTNRKFSSAWDQTFGIGAAEGGD